MSLPPSPAGGTPAFQISRRSFIKRCALVAAATGLPLWFVERQLAAAEVPAAPLPSPNNRPALAQIGCGGMGTVDALNASNFGDVVAIADVDDTHAAKLAQKLVAAGHPAPKIYHDFRRLLERDDIHAVVNSTPDHWHTLVNLGVARARKDVYSEKPLTLTIDEGKHIVKAVRDSGIVLQTGTQQRSSPRFRLACELVRNGRIGRLLHADVWLPAGLRGGPFAAGPVPAGLDWDFWQGQTPAVPYVKERCHTNFRYWYDYSGGTMTDWGAHHNDIAYWAIGIVAPRTVESRPLVPPVPGGYTAFSEYEVKYVYDNGIELNIRTTKDDNIFGEPVNKNGQHNGIRFVGTNGWIWVNRHEINANDRDLLVAPLPDGAQRLYPSNNHMGNFFDCVRSRKNPICDVETGHRSATMCHLGAISLRTGQKLTWDSAAEHFTGDHAAEANTYLAREMRQPYDYTFVG